MSSIQDLMNSIAQMEGFNKAGSLAQRNNNPGNLRASSLSTGTDSRGYSIFPDAATGWQALQNQIMLDENRGLTLRQFIYKYAPPTENDSANYLNYVSGRLGTSPDASLTSIFGTGAALVDTGIPVDPTNVDQTPNVDGEQQTLLSDLGISDPSSTDGMSALDILIPVTIGAFFLYMFLGR